MRLDKFYSTMAAGVVESLREEHLDLDRFVPALYEEMRSAVKTINDSADDYEPDELSWAAVTRYGEATTDHIDMDHIKAAAATLQNLKRRMEA